MTNADRAKLRIDFKQTKGCGKQDFKLKHTKATDWLDECDPCLDLLMEAARAGAVEECTKMKCRQCAMGVPLNKGYHVEKAGVDPSWKNSGPCQSNDLRALLKPASPPAKDGLQSKWNCTHCGRDRV